MAAKRNAGARKAGTSKTRTRKAGTCSEKLQAERAARALAKRGLHRMAYRKPNGTIGYELPRCYAGYRGERGHPQRARDLDSLEHSAVNGQRLRSRSARALGQPGARAAVSGAGQPARSACGRLRLLALAGSLEGAGAPAGSRAGAGKPAGMLGAEGSAARALGHAGPAAGAHRPSDAGAAPAVGNRTGLRCAPAPSRKRCAQERRTASRLPRLPRAAGARLCLDSPRAPHARLCLDHGPEVPDSAWALRPCSS